MSYSNRDLSRLEADEFIETPLDDFRANPFQAVHRRLRGRYRIVVGLALIAAVSGAIAGYLVIPPGYESTGLIRVTPTLPLVLYKSEENQAPPMFDSFVATQARLLESRDTLVAALHSPNLVGTSWGSDPRGIARLQNALLVHHKYGEQLISVNVRDRDPHRARAAVNAILDAFVQRQDDLSGLTLTAKEQALVQREEQLEQELRELSNEILTVSDNCGAEAVERLYLAKVSELETIERKLAQLSLANLLSEINVQGPGFNNAFAAVDGNLATLSPNDPLNVLRERELGLQAEIASFSRRLRPEHPRMLELVRQLDAVRTNLQLRESQRTPNDQETHVRMATTQHMPAVYESLRSRVRTEAATLGFKRLHIADLQSQVKATTDRLNGTRRRLDELRVETGLSTVGRINVAAYGELPLAPSSDRRAGVAAVCAMAGVALAVGFVFLFGVVEGRCRFVADLEALADPADVLAILPDETAVRAATSTLPIHELRNVLQLRFGSEGSQVYALTSPVTGDGKTKLALSLGAAFAASDLRALVIDADLVDRGMTSELRMEDKDGLSQALGINGAAGQVYRTAIPNMWALPAGPLGAIEPGQVSPSKLRVLIDAVRSRFDVIIIDTGSILESIEASVVCAVADETLMITAGGERLRVIEASLQKLRRAGVAPGGIIMNRAAESDVARLAPGLAALQRSTRGESEDRLAGAPVDDASHYPAKATSEGADEQWRKAA